MKQRKIVKLFCFCCSILLVMQIAYTAPITTKAATGIKIGTMTVGISKSESGSTLTLTASPSTTLTGGSYSYQWQMSSDGGATWSNINGATSSTYSVNTSTLSSLYRYRCKSDYTFTSDESYALINDAYLSFLNRNAESNGNQYWWNLLVNHTIESQAQIATDKFSLNPANEAACVAIVIGVSPEGASRGLLSQGSEAFVTACYAFLLGTTPDANGLAYWKGIYEQYESNTAYITYNGIDFGTINEGAIRVVNGIASNSSCGTYMSNKYAYNTSTGKYTYTQAESYIKSTTYYVSGTSKSLAVPEYAVTCEDRVGGKTGTLLGTQSTVKKYTNGNSVKGSVWGSDASDNAYYRGYKYTGCSTLTVNGVGTVYRYFSQLPDNVTYDYETNGGSSISLSDNTVYYPIGDKISLSPTAEKSGFTFIGWNTDKDAREGLEEVTSTSSGVTLYAIYRKDIQYKYHTMTSQNDYVETGYLYNKESTVYSNIAGTVPMTYTSYTSKNLSESYDYIGYSLDENKDNNQSVFTSGTITATNDLDIYCVYRVDGILEYYNTKTELMDTDSDTFYGTVSVLPSLSFSYIAKTYTPTASYQFDGWQDGIKSYAAGEKITTNSQLLKVYASESPVKVSSIAVSPKTAVMHIGEKKQLSATVMPTDAFDQSVEWSSSDSTIASVDESGNVTAHAIGSVTITAKTKDGSNLSDTATITVAGRVSYDSETNGGSMNGSHESFFLLSEDVDLTPVAVKDGYTFLGWNTDKDAREGLTSISMTESELTLYAIYRKNVTFTYHSCDSTKVYEQSAYLFNEEAIVYGDILGTQEAHYINHDAVFPNMEYQFVGYSISSSKNNTSNLYTSEVITKTSDTDFYAVYAVVGTLNYYNSSNIKTKSVTDTRYGTIETIPNIVFQYILDDYVPSAGYTFTGWKRGSDIYACGDTFSVSEITCDIYATESPILAASITVAPKTVQLRPSETVNLTSTVLPADTLNKDVIWTSSNEEIAEVDTHGKVTAHRIGEVTITATTTDGSNLSDSATVSVLSRVTYDYRTNGGTDCEQTYLDFKQDSFANLTISAAKEGYEFLGWNTDPDAHTALSSYKIGDSDVTLFAIFRKSSSFTYHLYDVSFDAVQDVYCFNKETDYYSDVNGTTKATPLDYDTVKPDDKYMFTGYSFDPDADALEDVETILSMTTNTPKDIYCLYKLTGQLQYYNSDNTLIESDSVTNYCTVNSIAQNKYQYVIKSGPDKECHVFDGWCTTNNSLLLPDSVYETDVDVVKVYATYHSVLASSVTVSPKVSEIDAGDSVTLTAEINPENTLDKTVVWSSSDESVATVDQTGKVNGVDFGTVVIKASSRTDADVSDTAIVIVKGYEVVYDYQTNGGTSFSEDNTCSTYSKGELVDLSATAGRPGYEFVGWNTDPEAHIGLSTLRTETSDITLYAIYRKSAEIKYHTYDAALDYIQEVYSFNKETVYYSDLDGNTPANTLVYPDEPPYAEYSYVGYSFDENASSEQGLFTDKALTINDAINIYCVYRLDGALRYYDADCQLMLTTTQTKYVSGPYADTAAFTFPEAPSYDVPHGYRFLGWSMSADQLVTPLMPGEVYTTTNPITDVFAMQEPITTTIVSVLPEYSSVSTAQTVQFKAEVLPVDALDTTVTWSSSDESIATVDQTGTVTGVSLGEAVITATANDGSGAYDTGTVNVVSSRQVVISGRIQYSDKTPIPDCPVFIYSDEQKSSVISSAVTDENGDFACAPVTYGTYMMEIQAKRNSYITFEIIVGEDDGEDVIKIRNKSGEIEGAYKINGDLFVFDLSVEQTKNGPITGDAVVLWPAFIGCLVSMPCIVVFLKRKKRGGNMEHTNR